MLYRVVFSFFKVPIQIVTNSKYVADFMHAELKNSSVTKCTSILSNDNGYIEKIVVNSQIGVAIVPGQSIEGIIDYFGIKIPFLQLTTFDNMQPVRFFLNSVVADTVKDYFIPLHASTVELNNKAMAFSGNKNSGKSTLTISGILWNNCKLISDDITFMGLDHAGNVICDGIFNGVHIFESEKYIYKNKIICSNGNFHEYLKKRIIFKSDYVTHNPVILSSFVFPTIIDGVCDYHIERISILEAKNLIRNNMIRFGISYNDKIENIIYMICEHCKMFRVNIGKNFLESMDFVYDSFINL